MKRKNGSRKKHQQYLVLRSKGEFRVQDTNGVYGINLNTSEITKAELVEQDPLADGTRVFKLTELPMHLYMPALNKDMAKIRFNSIINSFKKK